MPQNQRLRDIITAKKASYITMQSPSMGQAMMGNTQKSDLGGEIARLEAIATKLTTAPESLTNAEYAFLERALTTGTGTLPTATGNPVGGSLADATAEVGGDGAGIGTIAATIALTALAGKYGKGVASKLMSKIPGKTAASLAAKLSGGAGTVAATAADGAGKTLLQKALANPLKSVGIGLGITAATGAVGPAREAVSDWAGEKFGTTEKKNAKAAAEARLATDLAGQTSAQSLRGEADAERLKFAAKRYELDNELATNIISNATAPAMTYGRMMEDTNRGIAYLPSVPADIYSAIGISPFNFQQAQQAAVNSQQGSPLAP